MKRSGSGLAWRTCSLVTTTASCGTPSISRAGAAFAALLLVAIAQATPSEISASISSREPGSGRTLSRSSA